MPQLLRHFNFPARALMGLTLFLTLLFFSAPLFAQLGSGQVEGTVADATGAVVAKAKVTVTNTATGVSRELTTNDSGLYRATNLQPGTYLVKAEATGFAGAERKAEVVVGNTTTADITLGVQGAKESMTVTDAAPLIQTESSDVSTNISKEVVENVPVTGRRWENFVMLSPGVIGDGNFGLVSYRGVSGLYNNNQLDGMDNNQAFFSEARGRDRVAYTYSQAAIKEFQVGVSNQGAEFGRAAGGSVNAVTKSGTNDFHGQAFYFIRDSFTTAKDPFIDQNVIMRAIGDNKLPERRQQFGFAMGGPIVKDKLFWFVNYDQQIRNFPYVVNTSTSSFIPDDCTTLAAGNPQAVCQWFQDQRTVVPRRGLQEIGMFKLDWVINEHHNISTYFNAHRWRGQTRTPYINFNAASDNAFNRVRTTTIHSKWNWLISPTVVNELRFNFAFDRDEHTPFAEGPSTTVTGGFSFGMPDFLPRPKYPFEKRYQWNESISITTGNHTFKFGGDINHVKESLINLFQGGGVYSYSSFSAIAGDCPIGSTVAPYNCVPDGVRSYNSYTQAFDTRVLAGDLPIELSGSHAFNTTDWNFFGQDTWKIRGDMTLTLGVRYEYQAIPQPFAGNPLLPLTQTIHQDKNNFAPRLGFAWDIGGRHRTVLNAGYGISHGRTSNSAIFSSHLNNGTVIVTRRFSGTPLPAGAPAQYPDCFVPAVNSPTCTVPTPSLAAATSDVFQFAADLQRPMVHQAQVSLEHELFPSTKVSATYAYSGGRNLPGFVDINLPEPGALLYVNVATTLVDKSGNRIIPAGTYGPLPFYCLNNLADPVGTCDAPTTRPMAPDFTGRVIEGRSDTESSYHAMILRLSRRMQRGFLVDAHFTWAKAIDNGQVSQTFAPSFSNFFDPQNQALDRGRGNFDVRNRFVTSFVWEPDQTFHMEGVTKSILGDWRVGGTISANTGKPVNPRLSGSLSGTNTRAVDTTSLNGSGAFHRFPFLGRNWIDTPGFANMDLRLSRDIHITEGKRLEFLVEAFNLFNRVNVTSVDDTAMNVTSSSRTPGTACGTYTLVLGDRCVTLTPRTVSTTDLTQTYLDGRAASSTLTNMREFQFAAKFHW